MQYMYRLIVCSVVLLISLAILLFASSKVTALESIQYDELACEELIHGYEFNKAVLSDMMKYHDGCVDFADSPASVGSNDMLSCRFIREHGLFVQGIVNDLVAVFNIKCAVK